jgi:hypothetical protein
VLAVLGAGLALLAAVLVPFLWIPAIGLGVAAIVRRRRRTREAAPLPAGDRRPAGDPADREDEPVRS